VGQMFYPLFSFIPLKCSKLGEILVGPALSIPPHLPRGSTPTRTAPPPPSRRLPPAPTPAAAGSHLHRRRRLPPATVVGSHLRAAPCLSRTRRRCWAARAPPLFTPSTTPSSPNRRLLRAQNATGWLPCLSRIHPIKLVAGWPSPR
jgi:hypothetical protein